VLDLVVVSLDYLQVVIFEPHQEYSKKTNEIEITVSVINKHGNKCCIGHNTYFISPSPADSNKSSTLLNAIMVVQIINGHHVINNI